MTKEEKEIALHCLRTMIDEEVCEECDIYGKTGTDHCEADMIRMVIKELEKSSSSEIPSSSDNNLSSELEENSKKLENASPIIDWNNCHTSGQLDNIATTKNELAVDCVSRQFMHKLRATCIAYRDNKQKLIPIISIDLLPSVTPIRQKGHWIRAGKDKLRCSKCDVIHFIAQYPLSKIDWCPNCGAKMEVEEC